MSKVVRVLLTIAFLIFLSGVIWSFIVIAKKKDEPTATPPNSTITTSVATDSPTAPVEVTPAPPQAGVVTPTPSKKPRRFTSETVTTETVYFEETSSSSASAWASAGVHPDGSTWAEAHAEQ